MLALLSYPVLIEPNLPNRVARDLVVRCVRVLCGGLRSDGVALLRGGRIRARGRGGGCHGTEPTWPLRLLWLGLAAAASVLLLAVTTHLTQDVAPIPFLWIVPLAVYLLSFILCFESPRTYWRPLFLPLFAVAMFFMAFRLWPGARGVETPVLQLVAAMNSRWIIALFAAALFVRCMVCHGELARLKPHPRYLTGFYVRSRWAAPFGGLFVGLVAPNLFRAYYEFPIGLGVCALVVALVLRARGFAMRSQAPSRHRRSGRGGAVRLPLGSRDRHSRRWSRATAW